VVAAATTTETMKRIAIIGKVLSNNVESEKRKHPPKLD
jgi:hypothetical protein